MTSDDYPDSGSAVLPWHRAAFDAFITRATNDTLPHAVLVTAAPGTGLIAFADAVTATLLCTAPEVASRPCGTCNGCRQHVAGSHPDSLSLGVLSGQEITVEQARECIEKLTLARHYRGKRIVRIHPAERLNRSAANALLKTLEEPAADSLFLLLSTQPRSLPATIRSRTQVVALPPPAPEMALSWLQETLGFSDASERLDRHSGQPVPAADERLQKDSIKQHQQWKTACESLDKQPGLISETARQIGSGREEAQAFIDWLANRQWQQAVAGMQDAETYETEMSLAIYGAALEARAALRANTPPALALEGLFISWRAAAGRKRSPRGQAGR